MPIPLRVVISLSLSAVAFGQRQLAPAWSPGGVTRPFSSGAGFFPAPSGRGNSDRGNNGSAFPSKIHPGKDINDPAVVILPLPIIEPGLPDAGEQQPGGPDPAAPDDGAPPAVFQEPFTPPQWDPRMGEQTCAASASEPSSSPTPEEPSATIYLIALKSHKVVEALGYWIEAGSLHYVSSAFGLNQISLSLVDQDLSQRLNDERGVKFKFPSTK
jgi:hypothetical protein